MTLLFAVLPAIAAILPGAVGIALIQRWEQKAPCSNQESQLLSAASITSFEDDLSNRPCSTLLKDTGLIPQA
jgi:hypothetical protein